MRYSNYSVEDFLKDDFFVQWAKGKNIESNYYWEKWMINHPDKVDSILVAKEIINSMTYKSSAELMEDEFIDLFENILRKGKVEDTSNSTFVLWPTLLKVAAVTGAIILSTLTYFYLNIPEENQISRENDLKGRLITKANPAGQKSTIGLKDGSTIRLNAGSSISFNSKFSSPERVVYVHSGEAFFNVEEDPTRPFLIRTGELETMVLGTSFNVNFDSANNKLIIALVSGKVTTSDNSGNIIYLEPTEMVTFYNDDIEKDHFEYDDVLGWVHNRLVFNKATASEVVSKLEQWYGVEFTGTAGLLFENVYSGVYENETLENVLKGINYSSEFEYEMVDDKVIIKNINE